MICIIGRRRLAVVLVRLNMAENMREAVTFVEQGRILLHVMFLVLCKAQHFLLPIFQALVSAGVPICHYSLSLHAIPSSVLCAAEVHAWQRRHSGDLKVRVLVFLVKILVNLTGNDTRYSSGSRYSDRPGIFGDTKHGGFCYLGGYI